MRLVVAAGGTAGHVNPGIAVAQAVGGNASFIGTAHGIEAELIPLAGFSLAEVRVEGFDRANPLRLPLVAGRAAAAIAAARRVLRAAGADVVLGMGGYVSLPVCLAARSLGLPVVLHEQNIVLGLAHRVTKPFAQRMAVSFADTLPAAGDKGVLTGNPVLAHIANLDRDLRRDEGMAHFDLDPARKTVLIFGGSLGARTINRAAVELAELWRKRGDVQVLHVSGRAPATQVASAPPPTEVYRCVPYTDAMDLAYAASDLAVVRGGASTIAEITAVGLPAIVVPYPFHRDRQQERHGRVLERAGAGVVVADAETSGTRLAAELDGILEPARLATMSRSARTLGRPDAAQRVAELLRGVA